jgi:hypothetical protein
MNGLGCIGRGTQPLVLHRLLNNVPDPWFDNRGTALINNVRFQRIDIDTDYFMAPIGKAGC